MEKSKKHRHEKSQPSLQNCHCQAKKQSRFKLALCDLKKDASLFSSRCVFSELPMDWVEGGKKAGLRQAYLKKI